jgi:hypothetical protein
MKRSRKRITGKTSELLTAGNIDILKRRIPFEVLNLTSFSNLSKLRHFKFGHGSIPGYEAAVRQNAGKRAIISETRVLANCGYVTPICQTLNQAQVWIESSEPSNFGCAVNDRRVRVEVHESNGKSKVDALYKSALSVITSSFV